MDSNNTDKIKLTDIMDYAIFMILYLIETIKRDKI